MELDYLPAGGAAGGPAVEAGLSLALEDTFTVDGYAAGKWSQMFGTGSIGGGVLSAVGARWLEPPDTIEAAVVVKFLRTGSLGTTNTGIMCHVEPDDDYFGVYLEAFTGVNTLRMRHRFRTGGSSFDQATGPDFAVPAAPTEAWLRVRRIGDGQQSSLLSEYFAGDPDAGAARVSAFSSTLHNIGFNPNSGIWGVFSNAAAGRADLARFYLPVA